MVPSLNDEDHDVAGWWVALTFYHLLKSNWFSVCFLLAPTCGRFSPIPVPLVPLVLVEEEADGEGRLRPRLGLLGLGARVAIEMYLPTPCL